MKKRIVEKKYWLKKVLVEKSTGGEKYWLK